MRILLDTHIFLWWDNDPAQLSERARQFCEDPENTLILSVASIWEIQIKRQLGKLTLHISLTKLIEAQQKINNIEILPINLAHVLTLESLPFHHKDPFDRLLIAQANAEAMSLLSADPIFMQYAVELLS